MFEGIWKGVWGKLEIRDSLVGLGTANQLRDLRDFGSCVSWGWSPLLSVLGAQPRVVRRVSGDA